ncbi:MazG-like family protein [Salipaludibacillus aurantiacus]|uniref:MazG nucleotide pyrophosphohydrolase domain-containing protein n=1 Tax=Salipaludibacillus aurantiacus TaxID=1601833 RepID=A0A1H9U0J0_9BACI|nr:MazG-like family protein [Salipaludibacillus aurantiacus]SES02995.1 MazG nucleotide pyrophosphohydrolase domain-containing protein [Salipaludibacillus aurantiacus]
MNKISLDQLAEDIAQWAEDKELDEAASEKQMLKLMKEVGELAQGLAKDHRDQVIDSIGDVFVVLKILSMQLSLDLTSCVAVSYGEIMHRKGKMVNGVFVKQEDLKEV